MSKKMVLAQHAVDRGNCQRREGNNEKQTRNFLGFIFCRRCRIISGKLAHAQESAAGGCMCVFLQLW